MTSIAKPPVRHRALPTNALGLTKRDYEGAMSTLCAGCGHDSVTAAIVQACFELDIAPHTLAKLSGIGCSSKTTAYFVRQAHGFNSVHGRMPSVATGAQAANRHLVCVGVSGDGDSLSIGLGQLCHAVGRNVRLTYVLENNGVYGLTKGQFSASADVGSTSKRGQKNVQPPIDPVLLALTLGATFVARSFSGDKKQLVPILKAALVHDGFALVDVISPCVSFNDHEGSTKSYRFTREHATDVTEIDLVPLRREIAAEGDAGAALDVPMHDGTVLRFRAVDAGYDPTDRAAAYAHVRALRERNEIATGLLFVDPNGSSLHEVQGTVEAPLATLPFESLCPGRTALDAYMDELR
ncbi:thiamine pyrophosphate TPP-binding domain-containing protein [Gemmatirosa kalamazoonensis]|uniref:Thiamine pyrophosphate TPP-binding domain-containing protein n=1 Tax=Gemmatirosa kalamazoonensis TaxID=861299 RepID=W0RDZ2_9BACT|nr:2-oxoacid:ferredoxin oxidoreductase subunit beta [Gemmatirosa kalamazoonensis]AHG89026.1 thiamine pyrophosphate TPP-binding domain-containing protein [Gemmatirosa kalamazoonensis]